MSDLGRVDGNTTIEYNGKSMKYTEFLRMPRRDTMITRHPEKPGLIAVDKKDLDRGMEFLQELLFSNGVSSTPQLRPEFADLDPEGHLAAGALQHQREREINYLTPAEMLSQLNQQEPETSAEKNHLANLWDAVSNRIDELEGIQKKRNAPKQQARGMFNPMSEIKFTMNAELRKLVGAAHEEFKRVIKEEYLIPNGKKMSPDGNRALMLGILEKAHPGLFYQDMNGLIRLNDDNPFFEKRNFGNLPSFIRDTCFWLGISDNVLEKMAKDEELYQMIGEAVSEFDENAFKNDAHDKMMIFKNRRAWAFETLEKRFPGMFEVSEEGQIEFK